MLTGFIKHNQAISVVLMPLLLLVFWIYGFLNLSPPDTGHAAPLYRLIINLFSRAPLTLPLTGMLLVSVQAWLINRLAEKNEIIGINSYLPGIIYIILMSLQPEMFSLHPTILTNHFIILAIYRLMRTHRKETAFSEVFDSGFFIGICALLYFPSIMFLILLWLGLIIIRPFVWREWIIAHLGFLMPWIWYLAYLYWIDSLNTTSIAMMLPETPGLRMVGAAFAWTEMFQVAVLILCTLYSSGKLFYDLRIGTIKTKNNLTLLLYLALISLLTLFAAPSLKITYLSFLAIPFSIFFSSALLKSRKTWVGDLLVYMLIISIFFNQYIH